MRMCCGGLAKLQPMSLDKMLDSISAGDPDIWAVG